jgi:gamma-D-glutamyl-L-lysine dipeptidyl-peptidase
MTEAGARSPRAAGDRRRKSTHHQRVLALAIGLVVLAIAAAIAIVRTAGPGTAGPGTGGPANAGAGGTSAGGAGAVGTARAGAGGTAAAAAPARCASGTCYVAVNVATLWVKPTYRRAVDWPARANPADPRKWVAAMTVQQKLWLVGKLESQALYGTKVTVTGHYGSEWTKVAIPGQPTNRDRRGYPGWVPTRQLTSTAPGNAAQSAVVRSPTAWLWSSWTSGGVAGSHVMEVSYDTRLPVVRTTPAYAVVTLIGGRQVAIRRGDLVLHTWGTAWGVTRAKVVTQARKFLGLQYLWAGVSGFGYDCSGFTYSVYHAYGRTLSRDADQQAVHGTAVTRASLQPGDLVFFRGSPTGAISHVGMYVGGGSMIDAPETGKAVRIEPVSSYPYYAGARRYLSH